MQTSEYYLRNNRVRDAGQPRPGRAPAPTSAQEAGTQPRKGAAPADGGRASRPCAGAGRPRPSAGTGLGPAFRAVAVPGDRECVLPLS